MLPFDTMPQPVKLSDPLVLAARSAAADADRSIAGQIEHWARLGRAVESSLNADQTAGLKRGDYRAAVLPNPPTGRSAGGPASSSSHSLDDAGQVGVADRPKGLPPYLPSIDAPSQEPFPAWLEAERGAIETLCQISGVRRLGFFGSVLRADFDPRGGSDVDATVEFRSAPGLPTARQYFDFKSALEELLGLRVDLVELAAMPVSRLRRIIERTEQTFHVQAG